MDYHKKIRAQIRGLPETQERRKNILKVLVEALASGQNAAVEAIAEPIETLEERFAEKLVQLRKLL